MSLILAAKGAMDQYLTGNPQISFFKVVYRRYTNFSMEIHELTSTIFPIEASEGGVGSSTIDKVGDLLTNMWFNFNISASAATPSTPLAYVAWTNNTGSAIVENYKLSMGAQTIDEQDSNYLDVFNELNNNEFIENTLLNKDPVHPSSRTTGKVSASIDGSNLELFVDLKFWFCRNSGLSLPIICMQHKPLTLDFKLRGLNYCVNCTKDQKPIITFVNDYKLYGKYIYLDKDERIRFINNTHEYLIEQLQMTSYPVKKVGLTQVPILFRHPIKQLIWYLQYNNNQNSQQYFSEVGIDPSASATEANNYFNYDAKNFTPMSGKPPGKKHLSVNTLSTIHYPFIDTAQLFASNVKITEKMKGTYFSRYEPFTYGYNMPNKFLYMYSFALNPKEHQPSGTLNFSNIDSFRIDVDTNDKPTQTTPGEIVIMKVYGINYNVLRINSGQAGLAYSN